MAVNCLLHICAQSTSSFLHIRFWWHLEGVGRLTEEGRVGGRALSLSRFCCRLLCGALLLVLETFLCNCCWLVNQNLWKTSSNVIHNACRTEGTQKVKVVADNFANWKYWSQAVGNALSRSGEIELAILKKYCMRRNNLSSPGKIESWKKHGLT